MTDVLNWVQVVMQNARYKTWNLASASAPTVAFEDESTMGFVVVFDDAVSLLKRWMETERSLLARHAPQFHSAGEKSWNVYSVFLARERASEEQKRQVRWIEENLEQTRKLTATGVSLREDVTNALLPLLPIISKPLLNPEDGRERLVRRVEVIAPMVRDIFLDDDVSAEEVALRLRSYQ